MLLTPPITKNSIIEQFQFEKFKDQKQLWVAEAISYALEIFLRPSPSLTFDSIEAITLRRIWLDGSSTYSQNSWNENKPLLALHFSPYRFSYRDENKGRSLVLLASLGLKTLRDHLHQSKRPGLLFLSDISALKDRGIWAGKNCELDSLVSRIVNYSRRRLVVTTEPQII